MVLGALKVFFIDILDGMRLDNTDFSSDNFEAGALYLNVSSP